jgi:hypothetical protein
MNASKLARLASMDSADAYPFDRFWDAGEPVSSRPVQSLRNLADDVCHTVLIWFVPKTIGFMKLAYADESSWWELFED